MKYIIERTMYHPEGGSSHKDSTMESLITLGSN